MRQTERSWRQKTPLWDCYCRDARIRCGLSLDEVARQVDISANGLFYIEAGHNPGLATAVRLATFYGREISDLWRKPE